VSIIRGRPKANIVDKGKQGVSLGEFHGKVFEGELNQNIISHPTFALA